MNKYKMCVDVNASVYLDVWSDSQDGAFLEAERDIRSILGQYEDIEFRHIDDISLVEAV